MHSNSGAAALALAIVLRRRVGFAKGAHEPHNVPFVLLGASILWVGWYGFNAGSEGGADGVAGLAFTTTTVATCAAVLGWLVVETIRDGKPTTVGAASGAVAGLVAVTPACAFVSPMGAIVLGFVAGAVCALAIAIKFRFGFDDALDVVGVHLVGGITGTLMIGLVGFDHGALAGGVESKRGLFYGGGLTLLWVQFLAAAAVFAYSFTVTYVIGTVLKRVGILRVSEETEYTGLDETEHAESAYTFSEVLGGGLVGASASAAPNRVTEPAGQEA